MDLLAIRSRIDTWKSDDFYQNSKSYKEYESKIVPGEYYYVLRWYVDLKLYGISTPITQIKKFHTQTLALEPVSDNPQADLFRLDRLLPVFDNEFLQNIDDVYTKHLDTINPDGFY